MQIFPSYNGYTVISKGYTGTFDFYMTGVDCISVLDIMKSTGGYFSHHIIGFGAKNHQWLNNPPVK